MPSPRLDLSTVRPSPVTLMRVGDSDEAALRLRGDPAYTRVRSGVYAGSADWERLTPWERYLARVHAFSLVRPEAIFAYESAAALYGLPLFGEPRDVHIFDQRRSRSLRYGDVAVHTSLDRRRIREVDGFLLCGIADTVLDLARVLPRAYGLAVADAGLRRHPDAVTVADLREISVTQRNPRGRAHVDWILERATAVSESVGESVSRAVIEWLGFETPELQREFVDGDHRDRPDFFWPRSSVIGESDGYGKYDADDVATAKGHFITEKRREDRLRRKVRGFARWDWSDTMRTTPVRDALLAAGLRPIGPPQTALLRTVGTNRRSLPRP